MAKQPRFSTGFRTTLLESGMDTVFNSGVMEVRSGTQPDSADNAPTGTLLASIPLPADAFAAASAGVKSKTGTWEDVSADATGTATWFRIKASGDLGTTNQTDPRMDGSVSQTNGTLSDSGTATGGANYELQDSGKAWTANSFVGQIVTITSGTGSGQTRTICRNTATVLYVTRQWTTNPDATSVYEIRDVGDLQINTTAINLADKVVVDNFDVIGVT